MNLKAHAPILLALTLALPASAAVLPGAVPARLPAVIAPVAPLSLPSAPALLPSLTPALAPSLSLSAPAARPKPLPVPAALAAVARPAASSEVKFVLDWSRFDDQDGEEPASALVPVDPGPRPLSPAGAVNALFELREVAHEPIRMPAQELFDGRRELRESALPHDKFF